MAVQLELSSGIKEQGIPEGIVKGLLTVGDLDEVADEEITMQYFLLAKAMEDMGELDRQWSKYGEADRIHYDKSFNVSVQASESKRPLAEVVSEAFAERMEQSELVIRAVAEEVNRNNAHISSLNDIKKSVLEAKENSDTFNVDDEELELLKDALGDKWSDYISVTPSNGNHEVKVKEGSDGRDSTYDIINTSLDNKISEMNSLGQMTMIDLQSAMDKFTNATSALTNFLTKIAQADNGIVSNMR